MRISDWSSDVCSSDLASERARLKLLLKSRAEMLQQRRESIKTRQEQLHRLATSSKGRRPRRASNRSKSKEQLWLAVKLATSERVRMSPALRLRIPQPINSFKRSSTQSVRPTPQRLGPRTRPGLRRRVGADSRWGYNRWQIQLLLILGDSGKEVLGDSQIGREHV